MTAETFLPISEEAREVIPNAHLAYLVGRTQGTTRDLWARQGTVEAAALISQQRAIDDALENLAAGGGQPGEFFADDMVRSYKDARAAHAAKETRFKTGPQAALFRKGGDNLPLVQGGEVPRRFFNANASQVSDAQSFRALVQDDPRLMNDLRRYALSDAAGQVDSMGNLTNAKFNRWLEARSGAVGEIFTPQQRAWLKSIADDLRRAAVAESLGRSTGSDTAQKAASMMRLGLADSPVSRFMAGRIPGGNMAMDFFSGPARTAKAERLGGLLLEPERTAGLLDTFIATQRPRPSMGLLGAGDPLLYQTAPLLLTAGGR